MCTNVNNKYYGNLYWPYSICCNPRDEVIICDSLNNRLLVFSGEFLFKYQIGGKRGNLNGLFDEPCDIVLSEMQKLFIADKNNYRIQIFTEIRKFRQVSDEEMKQMDKEQQAMISSFEYVFDEVIKLKEKPVKICCSVFANVSAVSCENGTVFIVIILIFIN